MANPVYGPFNRSHCQPWAFMSVHRCTSAIQKLRFFLVLSVSICGQRSARRLDLAASVQWWHLATGGVDKTSGQRQKIGGNRIECCCRRCGELCCEQPAQFFTYPHQSAESMQTSPTSASSAISAQQTLTSFDHSSGTRLVFGAGTFRRLGELARELGGTRVLVVTDPGLREAGHAEKGIRWLHDAGLHALVFDDVAQNPTTDDVDRCVAFAKRSKH